MKLDAIQIFVSDINKAREWYSKILGMKLVEENIKLKYLVMRLGNSYFYIETPNPKWGEGWDRVRIGGRTNVIFKTLNINQTVNKLKEKGVRFVEEISKRRWGEYKAVFIDFDRNEFNLVQSD